MIKGIQKQMVMVKLQNGTAFETAYFVLRDGFDSTPHTDIVAEANSLAQGVFSQKIKKRADTRTRSARRSLIVFLTGAFIGALITASLFLIF